MTQQIKNARQAIAALGGTNAVATVFGLDVRLVANWLGRGLPPNTHATLGSMLAARGLKFSSRDLFGQRMPVELATAHITTRSYTRRRKQRKSSNGE